MNFSPMWPPKPVRLWRSWVSSRLQDLIGRTDLLKYLRAATSKHQKPDWSLLFSKDVPADNRSTAKSPRNRHLTRPEPPRRWSRWHVPVHDVF